MPRECVSHHHACDCREAKFKQILALAKFGREVLLAYDKQDPLWIETLAVEAGLCLEFGVGFELDLTPLATLPEGIE